MQNLVKYIMEILSIKSDSTFTIADIESEMQKINDFEMYREYIRDNIDNFDLKFKTGFQKFIILTNRFKRIEEDRSLTDTFDKATSYAKIISSKVELCRSHVEFAYCGFKNIYADGKRYFEVDELWALYETCHTTDKVIALSKEHNLEGEIYDLYISKYKKKASYESLTTNQKRVMELVKR